MARGFDSKSVADQQEERQRAREQRDRPAAAVTSARRRSLELARADLLRRLAAAPEAHQEQLRAALADLEGQIEKA